MIVWCLLKWLIFEMRFGLQVAEGNRDRVEGLYDAGVASWLARLVGVGEGKHKHGEKRRRRRGATRESEREGQ